MEMTIGKLKIGETLVMGKYGVNNDIPHPVLWLKGTPNGDFITKDAVDFLSFDGLERDNRENANCRYVGNPNYALCNLLQFLNSAEESWYNKMHEADEPPGGRNVEWQWARYDTHFGFLYYFEDYEIAVIKHDTRTVEGANVSTLIRFPQAADIIGTDRFKLFNKKGVRPNGTEDMVCGRSRAGFDITSYIPFWLSDRGANQEYAALISRSGVVEHARPKDCGGVRPVCTIRPETQVIQGEDGLYYIKPSACNANTFTDEELFTLLGMVQS